jgi:hypothetical protein
MHGVQMGPQWRQDVQAGQRTRLLRSHKLTNLVLNSALQVRAMKSFAFLGSSCEAAPVALSLRLVLLVLLHVHL